MKDIYKNININPLTGCWEWLGNKNEKGYGYCWDGLKNRRVHRWSFEIKNGKIPQGLNVLHSCDIRHCINPDHLFLGTQLDNIRDAVSKDRMKWNGVLPPKFKGENHPRSKLTENQVLEIRSKYKGKWGDLSKLAREYKVSYQCIDNIISGKCWK